MKRRASVRKAKHSIATTYFYKDKCDEILYQRSVKLKIDGQNVLITDGKEDSFLTTITNPKKMWFEIWQKLTKG